MAKSLSWFKSLNSLRKVMAHKRPFVFAFIVLTSLAIVAMDLAMEASGTSKILSFSKGTQIEVEKEVSTRSLTASKQAKEFKPEKPMEGKQDAVSLAILIVSITIAAIALGTAIVTANNLKKQMEQHTDHELTRLANDHNWNLFLNHQQLPPVVPAWRGLSDKGWAWRVLHLNHLNMLHVTYKDHKRGLLTEEDFEGWMRTARFLFKDFWSETTDVDIVEGREILRQVLKPEEGYPKEFREWMRDKKIIPPDLF